MKFKIGIPVFVNRVIGKLLNPLLPYNKKCTRIGGASPYYVYLGIIPKNAVIYSGGVGDDISFELDLYNRFNAKISIFDPSPTGKVAIKKLGKIPMDYYPLGLSKKSGKIYFQELQGEKSFRSGPTFKEKTEHYFECVCLSDVVEKGKRIDLLKIDIEGSEYGVIDDILDNNMDVSQIVIEFHHWFKEIPWKYTIRTMKRLHKAGYVLVNRRFEDYTYVKKSCLENLKTY